MVVGAFLFIFLFIYFLTLKIARELNMSGEGFEKQETTSTLTSFSLYTLSN